jgi:two-component system, NtrC family, sensor kinase
VSDEPTVDSTLVANLRRQLAACGAELKQRTIECDEARAREAASAEVLQLINSSPANLTPVFEAILEKAHWLCAIDYGSLQLWDGAKFQAVAVHGLAEPLAERLRQGYSPGPNLPNRALLDGARFAQALDLADIEDPAARLSVELGGIRTVLWVALRNGDSLLGQIAAARLKVRPFSEREIALLQGFADQAVLAMENARLLGDLNARTRELQESLEYQTATSEVLKVISRSTFDLQPVLDTLLETAARLCNSDGGGLAIRDGEVFRYVAFHGATEEFRNFLRQRTFAPGRDTGTERVLLEGKVVHIPDVTADPEYVMSETVSLGDWRTYLGVPLLREGTVVGVITLNRRRAEPFTERQIDLVRTFADQAVIAIENARLFEELRESLEQQTATSEILGVISSSPGELRPVFEKLLECALRLCNAHMGTINRVIDGAFWEVTKVGAPQEFDQFTLRGYRPLPHSGLGQMLATKATVQVRDYREAAVYIDRVPQAVALVELGGARSALQVPLLRENEVVGAMTIYRPEVRPFNDKDVALVESFAKQAVIAIENARLLSELRQSLEYQTATSDVLKVISRSAFDLHPVLDTLIETAARLCSAEMALVSLREGEVYRMAANYGYPAEFESFLRSHAVGSDRGTMVGRRSIAKSFTSQMSPPTPNIACRKR